jgi:hypothetical protein
VTLDRDAELLLELCVQRPERLPHLVRGQHGAQGVVLVEDGDAEDGHDGVPDELLDRASVPLDDGTHLGEEAGHDAAERLRIEPAGKLGRSGDVCEDDRDPLAHLACGVALRHERRTAGETEPRDLGVRLRAARANRHDFSVGRSRLSFEPG